MNWMKKKKKKTLKWRHFFPMIFRWNIIIVLAGTIPSLFQNVVKCPKCQCRKSLICKQLTCKPIEILYQMLWEKQCSINMIERPLPTLNTISQAIWYPQMLGAHTTANYWRYFAGTRDFRIWNLDCLFHRDSFSFFFILFKIRGIAEKRRCAFTIWASMINIG